jgi:hypothetical protein
MSEDAWANGDGTSDAAGDAKFTVAVDGQQQGGVFTATAPHSSGATQSFVFNGDWGVGSHNVTVTFLNDAYGGTATTDRNLYIGGLQYDGANAGGSASLTSNGSKSFTVTDNTAIPPPPPPPPSTDPAYYVSVNGSDTTGDGSAAHPFATLQV